ncbi:acyltransferase family protein [Mangrovivirga cuniculi]|uniref:Heparan-alpha-glucosaminide N-acetyltransferase n=1 Tax=Mangrovivirga cuniculi TaxID=2715131 RepID=A0A4D7K7F3_9BACT|nr:DUF5009 domain-containing protein [Mangrovivirga cuniculi]QCK16644.1 heparan-alpha-glucosaminide N-acetyltransferase [Mangrovivirga cuniculi]
MNYSNIRKRQRLISLDVFRGLTIMAMIIVNSPGSWSYMYPPLQHANWHGLTPTDLIFPFFLFIVGFSISLSLEKPIAITDKSIYKKIILRALKIFIVGLFLWLMFNPTLKELRWPGVLQRISVCFLITAVLYLNLGNKSLILISLMVLLGYSFILHFIPVPIDETIQQAIKTNQIPRAGGYTPVTIDFFSKDYIAPNMQPGINLSAYIDRQVLPGTLYEKSWDPEGLLSTFPAIITTITGAITGRYFKRLISENARTRFLIITGLFLLIAGIILSIYIPLNKHLWTSSFVLVTGGAALLMLAICYFFIDIKGFDKYLYFPRVYGTNAITAYVLSFIFLYIFYREELLGLQLNNVFMDWLHGQRVPLKLSSLIYSFLYLFILFIPLHILYRKKVFIKL